MRAGTLPAAHDESEEPENEENGGHDPKDVEGKARAKENEYEQKCEQDHHAVSLSPGRLNGVPLGPSARPAMYLPNLLSKSAFRVSLPKRARTNRECEGESRASRFGLGYGSETKVCGAPTCSTSQRVGQASAGLSRAASWTGYRTFT
jgi:hypothetical protein